MSFCQRAKKEIASITEDGCCRTACCYGAIFTAADMSANEIVVRTESTALKDFLARCINDSFKISPGIGITPTADGRFYRISINDRNDISRICDAYGIDLSSPFPKINRSLLRRECCRRAFLRGVFLGCGTITDPKKGYRLEFVVSSHHLSDDLNHFLSEIGYPPKTAKRGGKWINYYKDSESIEDILNILGASAIAFEMMNIKIEKEIRNNVNRHNNCDVANADKQAHAAADQLELIELLDKTGKLNLLPPDLFSIATLRFQNPELNATELGRLCSPPISKSSVTRRFYKIREYLTSNA